MTRRGFLGTSALATAALMGDAARAANSIAITDADCPTVRPPRLRAGSHARLVSPAGALRGPGQLADGRRALERLGLTVTEGRHALARSGYLAGTDQQRADDLMEAFLDPSVDAILCTRGGWGCARILPLLDYAAIRDNPTVLIGYSDITALHTAIYARSGLATYHGPTGISGFNGFTVRSLRSVVFDAEPARLANEIDEAEPSSRPQTITSGRASGILVGGNLSVFAALVGTPYMPDTRGHVLFLEDIGEDIYRVDRMLTQLALGGVLGGVAGIAMGQCTRCRPDGEDSFTLDEVYRHHFGGLGAPVYSNASIGHIADKLTVPVGIPAEIDADEGTLTLTMPAVV